MYLLCKYELKEKIHLMLILNDIDTIDVCNIRTNRTSLFYKLCFG